MFEDFETVLNSEVATRRRYCGFTRWLQTLTSADQQAARDLVENRDYNCRQLARYFQTKGATFNDQVLNRHRNGSCCGQSHA